MKDSIRQPYQFLLLALGGFFSYKVLNFLGSILLNISLLLLNTISFYPIEITIVLTILFQLMIMLLLLVILVKVYREKLTIPKVFFDHQFHKKVIISIGIIYLVNLLFSYLSAGVYKQLAEENQDYANSLGTIGEKVFFLELTDSIIDVIKKILFVIIYILLIRKESNND